MIKLPACPVEMTLQIMGTRWKILIIRDLLDGTKRFGELKTSLDGITQKVLTSNLRSLEENDIISREVFATVPVKVEYSLTELGKSLSLVLDSMREWGKTYKVNLAEEV
ncbi:helix-turn-helix domain-containing protein [uncultured Clostridium sp.]|uniref:winged helix-turn-helix transcriptional regulator n=1 Tax=uncultured Clostridium sp. TaxID=59620 RepID=UPI0026254CE4|nr:helix-turn-helix domain-containing protein [uncultured Clostridium sp.]